MVIVAWLSVQSALAVHAKKTHPSGAYDFRGIKPLVTLPGVDSTAIAKTRIGKKALDRIRKAPRTLFFAYDPCLFVHHNFLQRPASIAHNRNSA